ncbi:hypothetical protein GOODEAATRI_009090 [Goodea atripinnis]|uniref:Phosphofurin acidic cluster sorting protein 1/2 C-terminal domain-containing protein n=1 Tax=Goodea atripinnis TaxID=208336 RepID=A0ABV0PM18_9TELE
MSHSSSQTEIGSIHSQKSQQRELSCPVQEPETENSGSGAGEANSWDVNTERIPSTVGKLCKTESQNHMSPRLQRRPRSTSMKDRQNSKAQSDRTSSMESECSPDSRLIAQSLCSSFFSKVPRKSVYDQLNQILISDERLPESIILINTTDLSSFCCLSDTVLYVHELIVCLSCVSVQYVADLLHEQGQPIVSTCSAADVQAAFNTIVTRIQRL